MSKIRCSYPWQGTFNSLQDAVVYLAKRNALHIYLPEIYTLRRIRMKTIIFETVVKVLDIMNIKYKVTDEQPTIDFGVRYGETPYRMQIHISEKAELLGVVAVFPLNIPEDKWQVFYELINRLNCKHIGKLVIDTDEGELISYMTCTLDGGIINEQIVQTAITLCLSTLDDNYHTILQLLANTDSKPLN